MTALAPLPAGEAFSMLATQVTMVKRMALVLYEAETWSDQMAAVETLHAAGFRMLDIVRFIDDARQVSYQAVHTMVVTEMERS